MGVRNLGCVTWASNTSQREKEAPQSAQMGRPCIQSVHRSVKPDLGHDEFVHLRHVRSECGQSGVSLRTKRANMG